MNLLVIFFLVIPAILVVTGLAIAFFAFRHGRKWFAAWSIFATLAIGFGVVISTMASLAGDDDALSRTDTVVLFALLIATGVAAWSRVDEG